MNPTNRIAYITAQSPLVSIETFILTEMLWLRKLGVQLIIMPRDRSKKIFHKEAQVFTADIVNLPRINLRIVKEVLIWLFLKPAQLIRTVRETVIKSGSVRVAVKNLVILPKALYLCKMLSSMEVCHIHAHRGSTPSTMAYIISTITGIPWSLTLHRFDIYEDNILKRKVESAAFVRCISEKGRIDLLGIIGTQFANKIKVIHMGVEVPVRQYHERQERDRENLFTIAVAANLLPVKGHTYLIEACDTLVKKGVTHFKCLFYGDGPLKAELQRKIEMLNLTSYITICGVIPHEQLIQMYKDKEIDLVILPSVVTENLEFEGIPVSLMEAMAHEVPVISTDTGSIPELIGDGGGIMVRQKAPQDIAETIQILMQDFAYYTLCGQNGRKKIESDFNIALISKQLIGLYEMNFG